MTDFIEAAVSIMLLAVTVVGFYFSIKFGNPLAKANEYISWYKVGRIKQFAQEHNIDIDKVIAYEEIREKKKLVKTWTEKIEAELAKDLDVVEELNEKR